MKKQDLTTNHNITAKDLFNITGGSTLDKLNGQTLNITGVAIGKDVSVDTGELIPIGIMKLEDGKIVTTVSDVAIKSLDNLVDYMTDENLEMVSVTVSKKESNSGRQFIVLEIN